MLYRYKHLLRDAGMSVLDISLLSGFTVNPDDLNLVRWHTQKLRNTHSRAISLFWVETIGIVARCLTLSRSLCVCLCVHLVIKRSWNEHSPGRERFNPHPPRHGQMFVFFQYKYLSVLYFSLRSPFDSSIFYWQEFSCHTGPEVHII